MDYIFSYINVEMVNYWLQDIALALAIFFLFLVFRKIFSRYIFQLMLRILKKTETDFVAPILLAFEKPLQFFFVIIGIYVSLTYTALLPNYQDLLLRFFRSAIIVTIAWGVYNLGDIYTGIFRNLERKLDVQFDEILIPFLSKILRFITILFALSIIAQEWGYEVDGLIAGLGLGGLAFALAAQDTLSNIFGGIIIIVDKTFKIGDWIKSSSVEGTVEEITFRSTKVRTFSQALVTVPNSKLVNDAITNWSRMGKRQITFNVGVTYSTTREQMERCVEDIKKMLQEHEEVHPETIFVTFDRFNDSSLDIFLYFFTKTTVWGEFLAVKQDVNLKIMQILEENNVSVAFPTTTVYVENSSEEESKYMKAPMA
ncbi:mechanosensitive ion channel family protein [Heliorestis acidaminivorans]|uniref:Mechanosensitive ion channel family protein n=1 Tax=Heliorestis acidaminivorans TaxID=553427 RepID=A0A6I0ERB1_9FIRM|nr:mechanosensitive ion channel family protein [Heliorestis acidaminivorans]KAB2951180.1 mechanosensitive ion channel family protein [Heliorestis acidaminivorans]